MLAVEPRELVSELNFFLFIIVAGVIGSLIFLIENLCGEVNKSLFETNGLDGDTLLGVLRIFCALMAF